MVERLTFEPYPKYKQVYLGVVSSVPEWLVCEAPLLVIAGTSAPTGASEIGLRSMATDDRVARTKREVKAPNLWNKKASNSLRMKIVWQWEEI